MMDKKKRIVSVLKKNKGLPIEKISRIIKSNHWMTLQYLQLLEKEGKIINIEGIRWEIKK